MRIARGCLKNPKYIRVHAHSMLTRQPPAGGLTNYIDIPLREGLTNLNQLYTTWSPWVVTG